MPDNETTAHENHAGTQLEIDGGGNYSIDTREADAAGDTTLRLKSGASLKVEIGGIPALRIEEIGGWVRIELAEGADQRLVLGDQLVAVLNNFFQTKFDLHVHPTAMGPSGPPLPAFIGTQLDDSVLSDIARTKKS
jgi:hypothetical protein